MKTALPILILAMSASPALNAVDAAPAEVPPQATAPTAASAREPVDPMTRDLIANTPELEDVDPRAPEGKAKIKRFIDQRHLEQWSEFLASENAVLKQQLAMTTDEFAAVEPLLNRTKGLQLWEHSGPIGEELQDSWAALQALNHDPQANDAEATAAITRVRKAREAFAEQLVKAEDGLRAVLSPRQEAILLLRGYFASDSD